VFNSGATLMVNNTINIAGNFSQSAGRLVFGVNSGSSYGNLVVSGTSALTGGSISLTGVGSALQAGTYTIVSSGTGLSMSNLTFDAIGYRVTGSIVSVGSLTDLVLTVAGLSTNYAAVGRAQGGAAVGVGVALDRINEIAATEATTTPAAAAFNVGVLAPLAKLTEPQQRVALSQLAPSQITPQLSLLTVAPVSNAIGQHQQETSAALATGADAGNRRATLWGQFLGGGVIRDATTAAAGFDATRYGVLLGADWYAGDRFTGGLAFSWMNATANGKGIFARSRTEMDSFQLTAYGTWRSGPLSIEGQLGAGYSQYDQRRSIDFLSSRAQASYAGQQYTARVRVGYDLPIGTNFTLTPQYALRGTRIVNDRYSEYGANAANLDVARLKISTLTQELGLKIGANPANGVGKLSPDLRVMWVHEYKNDGIDTTSTAGGFSFATTTGRFNANGVAVGAGVTFQQSDRFRLRLGYDGDLRRDYQSHSGSVRLSWDF
jgi:outer membrane autotransporter protein